MKNLRKFIWIGVVVSAVGLWSANAQIWDASFTGSEMADTPWSVFGAHEVDGSNLIMDNGTYGALGGSSWAPVANDFTVEFVLSIQNQADTFAQTMYVFTPVGVWEVGVANAYARLSGVAEGFIDIGVDGTQANTYRLVVEDGLASLFVNGNATAASGVAANPYTELTLLSFGDRGSGTGGIGTWGGIQWNNSQAIAPVPEPSHLGLAGALFLGAVVCLRRRNSASVAV